MTRRPRSLPGLRPPASNDRRAEPRRVTGSRRHGARRHELDRPRRRHDRGDHLLHQHLEPVGDDRRRAAGEEGRREGPDPQAVGQDHAGPGLEGRHRLLRQGRPHALPGEARLRPRRLRLHHLHRQLRARCPRRSARRSTPTTSPWSRVLSGNRNFEGRINPDVKMNYLASPPLVVAYALAGTMDLDITTEPLGTDADGQPGVPAATSGPRRPRSQSIVDSAHRRRTCSPRDYADVFAGDERWTSLPTPDGHTFDWDADSTYVRKPPVLRRACPPSRSRSPTSTARGCSPCSATRSPPTTSARRARSRPDSPAGHYLSEHGVERKDFNSYGSRRGNHEVMIRGTFANIRLRNQLLDGVEGGYTRDFTGRRRRRRRSTTPRSPTRPPASRSSSSPARSTAPAPRATGRPRAPRCSA